MKKLLSILLVVALVFSMVACSNTSADKNDKPANETPSSDNSQPTTLTVGVTEMSGNFSPLYYSSSYDGYVVDLVYQQLIRTNYEGKLEPYLADSYTFSDDEKSITFKIKEGVKFSDGEDLTAEDIQFSYMVLSDPSYTGRYGSYAQDLVGYEEYNSGSTDEFKGVEVVDDYTVTFHFNEALRTNLENCVMHAVPKHAFPDYTYNDTSSVEAASNNPIGSGPYMLKEFKGKEYATLVKNPNYSGEGYEISNIVFKFVDMTTDITSLTTGEVDMLLGMVEPEKIAQVRNNDEFTFNEYPRSGYGYIKFNCEAGPTSEKAVRQALYYSFNIEEFVNSYFYDAETDTVLASVQYHPFSQVSWVIDDELLKELPDYSFNMEKAQQILEDAGWKVGPSGYREKDGQILELKVAAMPDHDILATLIPMWQRDWGEGLKCKVSVAYLEFNTILDYVIYNSDANVNEWSMFFLASSITSADPHSLYNELHSSQIGSGMDNTNRYNNPEVDKILDDAKAIMDINEAKKAYTELVKIVADDAVIVPVYSNTYFDLYNKKLTNFKTSSLYPWTSALEEAKIVE